MTQRYVRVSSTAIGIHLFLLGMFVLEVSLAEALRGRRVPLFVTATLTGFCVAAGGLFTLPRKLVSDPHKTFRLFRNGVLMGIVGVFLLVPFGICENQVVSMFDLSLLDWLLFAAMGILMNGVMLEIIRDFPTKPNDVSVA